MGVLYYSTRGDKQAYTASQAILQGLAKDGGLFVPDALPKLDKTMEELSAMDYKEVAYEVMKQFLTDYTEEELKTCIKNAYNDRFDTPAIAPTVKKAGAYYLELFHGPTIAFKDMALSILPHLMVTAAKKNNCDKEIVILTRERDYKLKEEKAAKLIYFACRKYRKGCYGRLCRCTRHQNCCILSKGRCQHCSGKADGNTEGKECKGSWHSRKLR